MAPKLKVTTVLVVQQESFVSSLLEDDNGAQTVHVVVMVKPFARFSVKNSTDLYVAVSSTAEMAQSA
jgi:hypothetical protein